MKTILNLNTIFLLSGILSFIVSLPDLSNQTPFQELTEIELLSKENMGIYYCLVLSSNSTDEDFIINTTNRTDLNSLMNISITYSYHKELNHPTVYCLVNGVLQFRKKIGLLNEELISFIDEYLNKTTMTKENNNLLVASPISNQQSFIAMDTKQADSLNKDKDKEKEKEDHIKKVIIAIIVVFLLSISLVLIIKYSIDWALSSRLELNFQKEIKKKDAIETLIENTSPSNHRERESEQQTKSELYDN